MKGHGLVQCCFPTTAQRYNQVLAFIKCLSTLSIHCVLSVDQGFCESYNLYILLSLRVGNE